MAGTYDNTSPLYRVRKWRNVPQETEDALEDFLDWLEHDDESPEINKEELMVVKWLVDSYLGRTSKVKDGEVILLQRWIDSVKGS